MYYCSAQIGTLNKHTCTSRNTGARRLHLDAGDFISCKLLFFSWHRLLKYKCPTAPALLTLPLPHSSAPKYKYLHITAPRLTVLAKFKHNSQHIQTNYILTRLSPPHHTHRGSRHTQDQWTTEESYTGAAIQSTYVTMITHHNSTHRSSERFD